MSALRRHEHATVIAWPPYEVRLVLRSGLINVRRQPATRLAVRAARLS